MSCATRSFAVLVLLISVVTASQRTSNSLVEKLDEDNWDQLLTGEWMVEFYAPWCPACKALEPVWESLAYEKYQHNINIGQIDVTDAPGLSGRFMVTALPTIYHVKDGIFRQYKSPRDKNSLLSFITKKTWEKIDPIPSWRSPTSIQMSIISQFFRVSQVLRAVHNKLMEDFGLPTWGSYLIFAVATIVFGGLVALLTVCVMDFINPPKDTSYQLKRKTRGDSGGFMTEKPSDDDLVNDVKDDLVDEEGSELEGKLENDKTDKENQSTPNSPNIRKRRARKAD